MSSYGLWLAAAGMKVSDHRQTILANNMANVGTTGFKHDLAIVTQRPVESRESSLGLQLVAPILDNMSGGVNVKPTFHSFEQGPIEATGKALDVAINGDGFFVVSDGEVTRYTRDGELARNSTGELVLATENGRWKVMSEGAAPIVLSETGGPTSIGADGTVRQGQLPVGKLAVVSVADRQMLRKVGENLFENTGTEIQAIEARLEPESREGSNFDIMRGLASMIQASRAYQLNATMIQIQDQMSGQAVSRVGRVA